MAIGETHEFKLPRISVPKMVSEGYVFIDLKKKKQESYSNCNEL
jgi:hypothetical protein